MKLVNRYEPLRRCSKALIEMHKFIAKAKLLYLIARDTTTTKDLRRAGFDLSNMRFTYNGGIYHLTFPS